MAVVKKGKKKWFQIVGPKNFRKSTLGESYVYSVDSLVGRKLHVNLSDLGEGKRRNVDILFRIKEVKDNVAYAEVIGYKILESYIKRVSRVGSKILSSSDVYKTKDNVKTRIKFILITKGKPNKSILMNLRKQTKEYLVNLLQNKTYDEFLLDVINVRVQRGLKDKLKKTYPLGFCEFNKILMV